MNGEKEDNTPLRGNENLEQATGVYLPLVDVGDIQMVSEGVVGVSACMKSRKGLPRVLPFGFSCW